MTKEHLTIDPKGALAEVVARDTRHRKYNEFRTVDVRLTENVKPNASWDEGVVSVIELRIGASFTTFRGDGGRPREAAYRALASHLYRDVLEDLSHVIKAIGDGERHKAMALVDALHERLRA